jgi:hypothetical protein
VTPKAIKLQNPFILRIFFHLRARWCCDSQNFSFVFVLTILILEEIHTQDKGFCFDYSHPWGDTHTRRGVLLDENVLNLYFSSLTWHNLILLYIGLLCLRTQVNRGFWAIRNHFHIIIGKLTYILQVLCLLVLLWPAILMKERDPCLCCGGQANASLACWKGRYALLSYAGAQTIRPHKKKLVYHPSHPKKVRREGGFYFIFTRFCCTMWVFKLHYYADIVAVVVCDKTCDTGPWRSLAHHN